MKMTATRKNSSDQAVHALTSLLGQVSAMKLKEIRTDRAAQARNQEETGFTAHVDVYGHRHVLVCAIDESHRAWDVRNALKQVCSLAETMGANATPVLITPSLSAEVRALCAELKTGCLDLDGNARLELGEFFIARHSQIKREADDSSRSALLAEERTVYRKFLPEPVEIEPSLDGATVCVA